MSKRKPNNPRLRIERFSRAVLKQYRVTVVHVEPSGRQGLIDYKTHKNIGPAPQVAEAVIDVAHPWVIYLAGFCQKPDGEQYIKACELLPPGMFKSESLAEVIDHAMKDLLNSSCNPNHLIGSGWIASPSGVSFSEAQAAGIFKSCGAWTDGATERVTTPERVGGSVSGTGRSGGAYPDRPGRDATTETACAG